MYCTDFIFDNEFASSHGYMIVSFNGGGDADMSGGEVTFTTSKPPSNSKWSYHGSTFESQLNIKFSISKDGCDDEYVLSQEEQSDIMRWLQRTDEYHWLAFDQDGFEDVWYNVQFNLQPHYGGDGRIIGFDVTGVCDSPYGYSQHQKRHFTLNPNTYSPIFIDYSDKVGEIHPNVTIKAKGNGNIWIRSGVCKVDTSNNFLQYIHSKDTTISNVTTGTVITLNEDYGLVDGFNDINNFNFVFPFIGNKYNDIHNIIENMSDIQIEITLEYRMIRRVFV